MLLLVMPIGFKFISGLDRCNTFEQHTYTLMDTKHCVL